MSRKRTILTNTFSNIALQVFQVLTGFILMPLVIGFFGKELFGIYVYIFSLVIILDVFSFSISMSLMKYVPEMQAEKKDQELHEIIYTMLGISAFLYFLLALGIYMFSLWGSEWFNVSKELQNTMASVTQIIALFTLVKFPYPIINGVLYGLQKWHLHNKTSIFLTIIQIFSYLVVTRTSSGLWEYVFICQLGELFVFVLRFFLCWKLLPVRRKWLKFNWSRLKTVSSFNLNMVVMQISDHLNYTVDKLILQKFIGSFAVTYYHVARRTDEIASSFMSMPLRSVLPALSDAFAKKDQAFIEKTNTTGTLLFNFLILPPLVALFFLYPFFIELWVGEGFKSTVWAGKLFLLGVMSTCSFQIAYHSLIAKGEVRLISQTKLAYSFINFFASCFLVTQIGLIGVVIPTVIYFSFVSPTVILYLLHKENFFESKELIAVIYPFFVAFILCLGVDYFLIFEITTWLGLLVYGTIYTLGYTLVAYTFVSQKYRQRLREEWEPMGGKIKGYF